MRKYNDNNNFKDLLKKKGFYISLMAAALCVVAFTAVYLNSSWSGNDSRELKINESEYAEYNENEDYSGLVEPGLRDNAQADGAVGDNASSYGSDTAGNAGFSSEGKQTGEKTAPTSEPSLPEEEVAETSAGLSSSELIGEGTIIKEESDTEVGEDSKTQDKKTGKKKKNSKKTKSDITVMESGEGAVNLKFDQEKGIMWPVSGTVIMNYSPDQTIYHKTLGVYKTNPALVVAADKGANVCSGVDSVVTDIGENEEIGKYVETSIGDGYKIIYGQLDNIQVKKGTKLKEGEIIGTIAEPTSYYVEEGSNLYLKMMCMDEPVDPMIFLR